MIIDWLKVEPQHGPAGVTGVHVSVLSVNEGLDREQIIQATCGRESVPLRIKQAGKREVFRAADGEFVLADGGTFNVLKKNE